MGSPYVGEIRMFAGNFAPVGWAFCNGATMAISENEVLFQLIGTTYGGDGVSTFNLPDLQGRIPVHMGIGSTGTNYIIGQKGGVETVTLTTQQIPVHTHPMIGSTANANTASPANAIYATAVSATPFYAGTPDVNLNAAAVQSAGGNQPHDNLMPTLAISFIISLFGVFPTQN